MRSSTRTALVVTAALTAAVTVGTTAATAATAPPASTASTTATGTVVQEGGPLVVPSGEEGPATARVKVALSHYTGGKMKARLLLPTQPHEAGNELPSYAGVESTCAVNGGAFQPCSWDSPQNVAALPEADTEAGWSTTLTYDIRVDAGSYAERLGNLTATLEVTDEAGKVTDRGPVTFQFVKGTPEAWLRTTVLARDKAGVLWQYESSGHADKPLKARTRIGGGWNAYTAIVPVTARSAAGEGDLMARDKDGVLWWYEASRNTAAPFKPRQRVGGGWNQYTALTGYGTGLLARDKAGTLWRYSFTGADDPAYALESRRNMGGGWNIYTAIAGEAQGYSPVARDKDGVLWAYSTRFPGFYPRTRVGGGWNAYNSLAWTGRLTGTGANLIARDASGKLWAYDSVYRDSRLIPVSTRKQIGTGWDIYNAIF
ncbi:tachylectin-related carbohydrate-binding protein [Streptomyces tanashiensis]|uniref:tachylectin-related carbohydrate-binding protein n=1 Tax=Streptomyces tanashiensis TaxID=67367 RepID=UPI00343DDED3